MTIKKIIVDEIPESCGDCCLMAYKNNSYPVCYGISDEAKRKLAENPFDMCYRRSDCPLCKEEQK